MKKKELHDWRNKTSVEISKAVIEERKKFADLTLELANGKVKNIKEIRNTRKKIAQLLTLAKTSKIQ